MDVPRVTVCRAVEVGAPDVVNTGMSRSTHDVPQPVSVATASMLLPSVPTPVARSVAGVAAPTAAGAYRRSISQEAVPDSVPVAQVSWTVAIANPDAPGSSSEIVMARHGAGVDVGERDRVDDCRADGHDAEVAAAVEEGQRARSDGRGPVASVRLGCPRARGLAGDRGDRGDDDEDDGAKKVTHQRLPAADALLAAAS